MLKTLIRSTAAALAVTIGFAALPALADGTGDALATAVVPGANTAIKNAMDHGQKTQKERLSNGTVAQVPPVQQQPVSGGAQAQGLPTGFTYTADLSVAYPYGNIGTYGKTWLPGGFDLIAGYGFNPTTRFVASVYQLQHYPVGFNSGTVPVYLNGYVNPVGCADLSGGTACGPGNGQNINVATKDTFALFSLEKLFTIKAGSRVLPIVITPTYVARTSKIGGSTSNDDVVPFAVNPPDATYYGNVKTRSSQVDSLAFTFPFLKTPKMFGTFTVAPGWLTHLNGVNQAPNHAQLYQILYLEYTPRPGTTLFLEPQSSRDYLPTDFYAQHLFAYFLGASQRIGKMGFVQAILNSGGPSNESPYGATAIYCQTVTQCAPVVGGLKATQIQLQFGIGSPSVIQF